MARSSARSGTSRHIQNSKTSEQLKRLLRKAFEIIVSSKPGQTVTWGVVAEKKYVYVCMYSSTAKPSKQHSGF